MTDQPVSTASRFCQNCGAPLGGTQFCVSCGVAAVSHGQVPGAGHSAAGSPADHALPAPTAAETAVATRAAPGRNRRSSVLVVAVLAVLAVVGSSALAYSRGWILGGQTAPRGGLPDLHERPELLWDVPLDRGPGHKERINAAMTDGANRLFVLVTPGRATDDGAPAAWRLLAYSVEDGSTEWQRTFEDYQPHDLLRRPRILGRSPSGLLVIQAPSLEPDAMIVHAVDPESGETKASREFPGEHIEGWIRHDGAGDQVGTLFVAHAAGVSRLDPDDLAAGPLWTYTPVQASADSVVFNYGLRDERLIQLQLDGRPQVLVDVETGEQPPWFREEPGVVYDSHGPTLLATDTGNLGYEDPEYTMSLTVMTHDGRILWRDTADYFSSHDGPDGSAVIFALERDPASVGSLSPTYTALSQLDATDGSVLWKRQMPEPFLFVTTGLDGQALVTRATADGDHVEVLDLHDGSTITSFSPPGLPWAVHDGWSMGTTTYYGDHGNDLIAWNAQAQVLWQMPAPGIPVRNIPGDRLVFITNQEGQPRLSAWGAP